ncbi:hypothetical protein FN846DRAFT_904274 [Sphaerosporella brunnea]|uniref:Uncharacterized protein n=1 Tax=Sphaerosporella brunnea TaxID=1250544 RepID=A0A5J5F5C8_9PEZI|nr:hypothetical protein FN846DRAFT_904274 [Sphaerosporella brunnea]
MGIVISPNDLVSPAATPAWPLTITLLTSLFALLLSRLTRHVLSALPATHRYHRYPAETQRRLFAQTSTLLLKLVLLFYLLPFLPSLQASDATKEELDALTAVLAGMYIFDLSHHHARDVYFLHHILVLICALLLPRASGETQQLLTRFLTPFMVGVVLADSQIEIAWLIFRLSPLDSPRTKMCLALLAQGNRAVRIFQWLWAAVYLRDVARLLGPGIVVVGFWAWCEWWTVGLCFCIAECEGEAVYELVERRGGPVREVVRAAGMLGRLGRRVLWPWI